MYTWHARLVALHSSIWMHLDRAAIFISRGLVLSVAPRDKRENKPQKQKDYKKMVRKILAKLLQKMLSDIYARQGKVARLEEVLTRRRKGD